MSEQTNSQRVPEWDTADRMKKALREAGIGVQEMADYLGVARNTVSTWINGRIEPSTQTLRLWALRCGVPYGWLKDGELRPNPALARNEGDAEFRCAPPWGQRSGLRIVPLHPAPGRTTPRPVWCAS